MSGLPELVTEKDVMIVCGSGGVGKTTTAAAIAASAAMYTDRRVLVLTVDPARRLADALRLRSLGNEAVPVSLPVAEDGSAARGRLFAAMLDAKKSWDDLVYRHAPDARTAKAILANPLYRNISGRFVQSHDYIAMERLYELHAGGDYDLIVIDTPPSSHAIDFLEAPARMASFFDSKFLRFLVAPSRSLLTNLASRPFIQVADRILGKRFLADITAFFTLLESMRPGFISRAQDVERLLRSGRTTFLVVSTLEPAPRKEADRFIAELARRRLELGAIILNRTLPPELLDPECRAAALDLLEKRVQLAATHAMTPEEEKKVSRVLEELSDNFFRFEQLAISENNEREVLEAHSGTVVSAPWFGDELADTEGLLRLGRTLWR